MHHNNSDVAQKYIHPYNAAMPLMTCRVYDADSHLQWDEHPRLCAQNLSYLERVHFKGFSIEAPVQNKAREAAHQAVRQPQDGTGGTKGPCREEPVVPLPARQHGACLVDPREFEVN